MPTLLGNHNISWASLLCCEEMLAQYKNNINIILQILGKHMIAEYVQFVINRIGTLLLNSVKLAWSGDAWEAAAPAQESYLINLSKYRHPEQN